MYVCMYARLVDKVGKSAFVGRHFRLNTKFIITCTVTSYITERLFHLHNNIAIALKGMISFIFAFIAIVLRLVNCVVVTVH